MLEQCWEMWAIPLSVILGLESLRTSKFGSPLAIDSTASSVKCPSIKRGENCYCIKILPKTNRVRDFIEISSTDTSVINFGSSGCASAKKVNWGHNWGQNNKLKCYL